MFLEGLISYTGVYSDADYLPSCCCDFYRQHGNVNRVQNTLSRTYALPHSQGRDRQRWTLCLLRLGPGDVPAVCALHDDDDDI